MWQNHHWLCLLVLIETTETEAVCLVWLEPIKRAHTTKSLSCPEVQTSQNRQMFAAHSNLRISKLKRQQGFSSVFRIQHRPHGSTVEAGEGCRCRSRRWRGSRTKASQPLGNLVGAKTIRSSWEAWKGSAHFYYCPAQETCVSSFDWNSSSRQYKRGTDSKVGKKLAASALKTSIQAITNTTHLAPSEQCTFAEEIS